MKRILVHLRLSDFTGVNTFIYTVISKLSNDFNFTVWIQDGTNSAFTTELAKLCKVVFDKPNTKFDEIWLNYYTKEFDQYDCAIKQFVHGSMNDLYNISQNVGKVYVFSERALENISHPNKVLIRNGIDLDRFSVIDTVNSKLQNILIHDSRSSAFSAIMVLSVAQRYNAYVKYLGADGLAGRKIWDVENFIKGSDLVLAYGRSAYEAMAMGKVVIIYGLNGGDGIIDNENCFLKMLRGNCSGFAVKSLKPPHEKDWKEMSCEFGKYQKQLSGFSRYLAEKYLDINLYLNTIIL